MRIKLFLLLQGAAFLAVSVASAQQPPPKDGSTRQLIESQSAREAPVQPSPTPPPPPPAPSSDRSPQSYGGPKNTDSIPTGNLEESTD